MFQIAIDTSNDDFQSDTSDAVIEAMRKVAAELKEGYTSGRIRDRNGNTVGSYQLTPAS